MQSTFRANYSVYGGQACGVLGRLSARTMQFYLNCEQHHPSGEDLVFGFEHHAMCQEPTEVARMMGPPERGLLSRPGW